MAINRSNLTELKWGPSWKNMLKARFKFGVGMVWRWNSDELFEIVWKKKRERLSLVALKSVERIAERACVSGAARDADRSGEKIRRIIIRDYNLGLSIWCSLLQIASNAQWDSNSRITQMNVVSHSFEWIVTMLAARISGWDWKFEFQITMHHRRESERCLRSLKWCAFCQSLLSVRVLSKWKRFAGDD